MSQLSPVALRERMVTLDVLRGFALCGVLIGNLFWLYSGRMWGADPPGASILDDTARWFVAIVVQSKAQTLLTFLFGFGFAVQLLRSQDRNEPVMGIYVRRLLALLVIGVLHVVVLWWGDVTWTYAVAGFGLLLFQRASNRARIAWAFALIFVPHLLMHVEVIRNAVVGVFSAPRAFRGFMNEVGVAARGTSYLDVVRAHVRLAVAYQAPIYAWYYAWLVGRFLLGYVAGTQRWFENEGANHLELFRRMLAWGLLLGSADATVSTLRALGAFDGYELTLVAKLGLAALQEVGYLSLAAAYMALLVLLMQRAAWRRVLVIVAPAGRMPLTTYILQSAICVPLFYGWGFGLAGELNASGCLGLAFAIFAVEVALCHLWLRWFRFGPLEWVWRTAVYLRRSPMRV